MENDNRSDVRNLINRSYDCFESGDFDAARELLDEAHALDFENREIRSALRACGYWSQRFQCLDEISGGEEKGDYLRRQWIGYEEGYRRGFEHPLDDGSARLKKRVHDRALEEYLKQAEMPGGTPVLLKAGRCLKILGRFEKSIATLERALREAGDSDARLLAELADTYALVGEMKASKVLMREALFLNAGAVDLEEIASPLYRRLIERLSGERDRNDRAFAEWLPVYGAVWGVLDVRREISPVEYGKLKQAIYAMKSEIADGDEQGLLTPRLINHYFRLIEHYQSTGADRTAIDEAMISVKLLSPSIYMTYFE